MQKLLIADYSEDFRLALSDCLRKRFQVFCAATGSDALDILRAERPQVLVLELSLPGLDGITMLDTAAAEGIHPKVLAITDLVSDYVINSIQRLNIAYLIRKPCSIQAVAARAEDLGQGPSLPVPRQDPRSVSSKLLLKHSLAPKHHGFAYLTEALVMAAQRPGISVTKELYPAVAKIFQCKPGHVERSIRNALEVAWEHRDEQIWQAHFPNAQRRPTNAHFISRLAEILRSEAE